MEKNIIQKLSALTGLSQVELGEKCGLSKGTINAYANSDRANNMPKSFIDKALALTNEKYEHLFGTENPDREIVFNDLYLRSIAPYTDKIRLGESLFQQFEKRFSCEGNDAFSSKKNEIKKQLKTEIEILQQLSTKVNVCFLGGKSSGKSAIVNAILNKDINPINEGGGTKVPTIFKRESPVDLKRYCNARIFFEEDIYEDGDYRVIFNSNEKCKRIEVYIDNPILEQVNLIDYPGGYNDIIYTMDFIVYISESSNFLNADDVENLKAAMLVKGIDKLCIVFSKANLVPEGKLEGRMQEGFERVALSMTYDQIKELGCENEEEVIKKLSEVCYCYDVAGESYWRELHEALSIKYEFVLKTKIDDIREKLKWFDENKKFYEYLARKKELETKRNEILKKILKMICSKIQDYKIESKRNFKTEYKKILSETHILRELELKKVDKKNVRTFSGLIGSQVTETLQRTLNNNVESLKKEIKLNEIFDTNFEEKEFKKNISSSSIEIDEHAEVILELISHVLSKSMHWGVGVSFLFPNPLLAFGVISGGLLVSQLTLGTLNGDWKGRFARNLIRSFEKNKFYDRCEIQMDVFWDDFEEEMCTFIEKNLYCVEGSEEEREELKIMYREMANIYGILSED